MRTSYRQFCSMFSSAAVRLPLVFSWRMASVSMVCRAPIRSTTGFSPGGAASPTCMSALMYIEATNFSNVISKSFALCACPCLRISRSIWSSMCRVDSLYALTEACCSEALGASGSAASDGGAIDWPDDCAGCLCAARSSLTRCWASRFSRSRSARRSSSSTTSWRSSPSVLNSRRSVTTKSGFLFSLSGINSLFAIRCSPFALRIAVEGQRSNGGVLLTDLHCRAWNCDLAMRVPERQRSLTAGKWNTGRAGHFARILVVDAHFGSRLRRSAFHLESDKAAMQNRSRANAFHNLLPDVAALGEVQRIVLSRLLRQITLAQIDSEARHASNHAIQVKRLAACRLGSGGVQRIPHLVSSLGREADVAPHRVDNLTWFKLGDCDTSFRQHFLCLRTKHPYCCQLVADVGNLDVIHDDVAIEDGDDGGRLRAVGRDQQIVAAIIGNEVSLNLPLCIEQKAVHAVPMSKIANVVGDHSVQPADAVFTGQHQLGLPIHVNRRATFEQRAEFSLGIAKRSGCLSTAIAPELRARRRKLLLNGGNTHTESLIIAKRERSLRTPKFSGVAHLLVETSHPAMLSQLAQRFFRKRPGIRGSRIPRDVAGASHTGNDGRDSSMRQTEPQGDRRKLIKADTKIDDNRQRPLPSLLLATARKVRVAKVAFGKRGVGCDLAGQAAFVERHADDHADTVLLTIGEQFVRGRLVEDVVDHLHRVDQSGVQRLQHICRLMALDRDADELRLARRFHLANCLVPFLFRGPFVVPGVELIDVHTFATQVLQRLVPAFQHILLGKYIFERSSRLHIPDAVLWRNLAGYDHLSRLAETLR